MRHSNPTNNHRKTQRGSVALEGVFGSVIFLAFFSVIFDFGIAVHRQSMLRNLTLKTVQQVTRDPQAGYDRQVLETRTNEIFQKIANPAAHPERSSMKVANLRVDCKTQQVYLLTKWTVPCPICFFSNFKRKMYAHTIGLLEVPEGSLQC